MSSSSSSTSYFPRSDVVNYSSAPSAPIIIPIVFFVVLGALIICIIIKLLLKIWDRHHKSKTYKFVYEESKSKLKNAAVKSSSAKSSSDQKPSKSDPKLSSLIFIGHKSHSSNVNVNNNVNEYSNENGSLTIEANIHDSSAETNETELINDDRDTLANNLNLNLNYNNDHIPVSYQEVSRSRVTESDV